MPVIFLVTIIQSCIHKVCKQARNKHCMVRSISVVHPWASCVAAFPANLLSRVVLKSSHIRAHIFVFCIPWSTSSCSLDIQHSSEQRHLSSDHCLPLTFACWLTPALFIFSLHHMNKLAQRLGLGCSTVQPSTVGFGTNFSLTFLSTLTWVWFLPTTWKRFHQDSWWHV